MSITEYIRSDLALRLRSGKELPAQLTLESLAELYDVSFTPVRAAIAGLIDDGLLEKGPNRRLMVCKLAPEDRNVCAATAAPPEAPRDPFDVILEDLVELSLQGKSTYLREESMAEKYDITRSRVRYILHKLAGEGVLDHIPRRGWRLRPFRQSDLKEFVDVRQALELKALELAMPRLDKEKLQEILDKNVLPQPGQVEFDVDESLHSYLIETAGNAYIRDFFERQGRYFRMLFRWEDRDRAAAVAAVHQHREVLEALLGEDWAEAKVALSNHILTNHPVLMTLPTANGGRAAESNTVKAES